MEDYKIRYEPVPDGKCEELLRWATKKDMAGKPIDELEKIVADRELERYVEHNFSRKRLLEKEDFTNDEIKLISEALRYALEKHGYEPRADKSLYASHLIETARIIVNSNNRTIEDLTKNEKYDPNHPKKLDYITMMGAFLHDVVEDTDVSLRETDEKSETDVSLEKHLRWYISEKAEFEDKKRLLKDIPKLMQVLDNLTRRRFPRKDNETGTEKELYTDYMRRVARDYRSLLIKTADAISNVDNMEEKKPGLIRKGFREIRDWASGNDALGHDNLVWRKASTLIHKIPPKWNFLHYYDRELNFENTHKIKTAWKAFIVADEAARYSHKNPDEHPYMITLKQALADSIYDRLTKVAYHIQKHHMTERDDKADKALRRDFVWHKKMRRLEWIREFEDPNEIKIIECYDKKDFRSQMYGKQDLTKEFKDLIDYGIHIAKSDGRLYSQTKESDDNITDGIIDEYLLRVLRTEESAINKLRFNKPTQYKVARIFAQIMNKYIDDNKFAFEWRETA